jgi:DNA-directed RNA polymerase I, II, and III subunit RPABC2
MDDPVDDEVQEDFEELEEAEDDIEPVEEKTTYFSDPIEALLKFHPECVLEYEETDLDNLAIKSTHGDTTHRSMPFLSTFEKTKILGMRTNQLAQGARPYVIVPEHITNVFDIAKLELEERKLPLIIKRYMPDGTYEKFRLTDFIII